MQIAGPWRPVDKRPPAYNARQRAYEEIVDSLVSMWDARLDAGLDVSDEAEWGVEVPVSPPVDSRLSGMRAELSLRDDPTHEGLKLRARWAVPMTRWNSTVWRRETQIVTIWLVRPVEMDQRVRGIMEKQAFTETKKLCDKPFDDWQKRTSDEGVWKSKAPALPPHAGAAELAAKFRFFPGENTVRFKQRMGISGQYSISEWVKVSGYPVGIVTPEQEAEWRRAWFDSGLSKQWEGTPLEAF